MLEKQALRQSATATRSECEREAREAAANLVLSAVLPHSVRMGTRVLETLGNMREILSYDSIGCKQALPIFEELGKAGQEPVGEDYPATELEHRLAEWLERRAAAPDTPPVKPQSPRQPIYLSVKRKASKASEPEPEKPEPEVTTFLLPRAAEPREEDFMRNKAAPVFHSSNHVLVPCEFRHTGPGVRSRTAGVPLQGGGRQVPGQRLRLDGVAPRGESSA